MSFSQNKSQTPTKLITIQFSMKNYFFLFFKQRSKVICYSLDK